MHRKELPRPGSAHRLLEGESRKTHFPLKLITLWLTEGQTAPWFSPWFVIVGKLLSGEDALDEDCADYLIHKIQFRIPLEPWKSFRMEF